MLIIQPKSIVAVNVYYYLPLYPHIINEFMFETEDLSPRYPRVHKFLKFWHDEIDAILKEVVVTERLVGKRVFINADVEITHS